MLTDPPYQISTIGSGGHKYDHFDNSEAFSAETLAEFVKEWARVLAPGGTLVCWYDVWKLESLKAMCEATGAFLGRYRTVTWEKDSANHLGINESYLGWTEFGLVVSKKPSSEIVFNRGDLKLTGNFKDKLPRGKERTHPTQKPLELFQQLVQIHTNPGDIVLDSFSGSGTTAHAALSTGRQFVGAELNTEYHEASLERLKDYL